MFRFYNDFMGKQDTIYEAGNLSGLPFSFNQEVTEVFEDMIDRSVPGYKTSLNIIRYLSKKYYQENTNCYDIGCSLGASSAAILDGANSPKVIAVDNSEAMISECRRRFESQIDSKFIEFKAEDIMETKLENASAVVINYVIQFLDILQRDELIKRIHNSLVPGGILILSEKIHFTNQLETNRFYKTHHKFKSMNGYSDMEIAGKRDSLEGVLITETEKDHIKRAIDCGFARYEKILSNLNFRTFIFFK